MLQVAGPVDFSTLLIKAAEVVIAGAVGYIAREFGKMRDEMTKWRVHLLGVNGTNGLTGDTRALQKRAYLWDKQLGEHETRITVLEYQQEQHDHADEDDR